MITVYQKPTCTKCRQAFKLLRERGEDFEAVNYYEKPLSKNKLKELLKKMDLKPREAMRNTEKIYRDLKIAKADYSDDELINLMIKHPDLIQRPIVVKGNRVVMGRPTENIEQLL